MSRFQDYIRRGIRADQPVATVVSVGTLYCVTDEDDIIERSNGTTWQSYSPAAAGTPAFVQLDQIVTTSSQATVDFTSISGSYSNLKIVWQSQDTAAGTGQSGLRMRFNNDNTAANYTSTGRLGAQNAATFVTTVAASTSGVNFAVHPNAGNTSITATGEVILAGYAGTTWHKRVVSTYGEDDGTTNITLAVYTARWKSTAAITRVTILTDGTAFTDGSTFTLYGLL